MEHPRNEHKGGQKYLCKPFQAAPEGVTCPAKQKEGQSCRWAETPFPAANGNGTTCWRKCEHPVKSIGTQRASGWLLSGAVRQITWNGIGIKNIRAPTQRIE